MNGYGSYPSEYENYDQATKRRRVTPGSVSSLSKFRFRSQVPAQSQSLPEVKPARVRYMGDNGEVNPDWRPEHGLPKWLRNQIMAAQGSFNEAARARRQDPNTPEAIAAREFWNRRQQNMRDPNTYMRGRFERNKGPMRNPLFGM